MRALDSVPPAACQYAPSWTHTPEEIQLSTLLLVGGTLVGSSVLITSTVGCASSVAAGSSTSSVGIGSISAASVAMGCSGSTSSVAGADTAASVNVMLLTCHN